MKMEKEVLESGIKRQERSACVDRVISMEIEPAIPKGDNYLSAIYRVTMGVVLVNGRRSKRSVILKMVPPDETRIKLSSDMGVFRAETRTYTIALSEMEILMEEFGDTHDVLWCKILHYEPYRLLLLEDLKTSGFRMIRRQDCLDLEHTLLVMTSLGRFHAMAKILELRGVISKEDYKPYNMLNETVAECFFCNGLRVLTQAIEKLWGPEWCDVAEQLKTHIHLMKAKVLNLSEPNESRFNCLNHGDCWSNNMMFKYDWRNRPITMRFVDWQIVHYNTPAFDLVYALFTSVERQVREENYDRFLSTYLDAMNSTFNAYGIKDSDLRKLTLEELEAEIERIFLLKIWSLITIHAAMVNERNDVFDVVLSFQSLGTKGMDPELYNLEYRERNGADLRFLINKFVEKYAKG